MAPINTTIVQYQAALTHYQQTPSLQTQQTVQKFYQDIQKAVQAELQFQILKPPCYSCLDGGELV